MEEELRKYFEFLASNLAVIDWVVSDCRQQIVTIDKTLSHITTCGRVADDEWLITAYPKADYLLELMYYKMHDKVATLRSKIKANVDHLKGDVLDKLEGFNCCSIAASDVTSLQISSDEILGLQRWRVMSLGIVRDLHTSAAAAVMLIDKFSNAPGVGVAAISQHGEEESSSSLNDEAEAIFGHRTKESSDNCPTTTPSVGDIKVRLRPGPINSCESSSAKMLWEAFQSWEDKFSSLEETVFCAMKTTKRLQQLAKKSSSLHHQNEGPPETLQLNITSTPAAIPSTKSRRTSKKSSKNT